MYRQLCSVVCFFALFNACLGLLEWSRLNPHRVEDGTVIEKNETHISFYQPSGRSLHYHVSEFDTAHFARRNTNPSQARSSKRDVTNQPGWVASYWTPWLSSNSYTYMSGQWTVPPAPVIASNNVVFFFNSFEGGTGSNIDILQPVLQFELNGGWTGWTLASWYGYTPAGYTESTPVAVQVGDTITGVMQLSGGYWSVLGYVNGVLKTNLTILQSVFQQGAAQNSAQWAMEAYNFQNCADFPPNNFLSLTNVVLKNNGVTVDNPTFNFQGGALTCNAGGYITTTPSLTSSGSAPTLTLTWDSHSLGALEIGSVGLDYHGGDFAIVNATSAVACAQACDGYSNCLGWTWDITSGLTCWLKSSVTTRSVNAARITGVKQGQVGYDRNGNDLPGYPINLPQGTAATCAAYCGGNAACQSWAFNTCSKQCWLKGAVGTATTASCTTSGVKGVLYTDHFGGDMGSTEIDGVDTTVCANLCAATSGCTNWVFTMPNLGCSAGNNCYLKNSISPSPTVNPCFVSGNVQ